VWPSNSAYLSVFFTKPIFNLTNAVSFTTLLFQPEYLRQSFDLRTLRDELRFKGNRKIVWQDTGTIRDVKRIISTSGIGQLSSVQEGLRFTLVMVKRIHAASSNALSMTHR
jgi:hypothetical protein